MYNFTTLRPFLFLKQEIFPLTLEGGKGEKLTFLSIKVSVLMQPGILAECHNLFWHIHTTYL